MKKLKMEPRYIKGRTWEEVKADLKAKYGDKPITVVPNPGDEICPKCGRLEICGLECRHGE